MDFEWDEEKSERTLLDRGVSFRDAQSLWLVDGCIEVPARCDGEPRWARIGLLKGKLFTVIFTIRGPKIRIISIRRSKPKEEERFYHGEKKKRNCHRRI